MNSWGEEVNGKAAQFKDSFVDISSASWAFTYFEILGLECDRSKNLDRISLERRPALELMKILSAYAYAPLR